MFGPPADAAWLWLGLALVSALFVGLAADVPEAPAPAADAVAGTVDSAAASAQPTRAAHPTTATELRISNRSISLRNGAGTDTATLEFGPVTPARGELGRVLRGAPPGAVFEDGDTLAAAARSARAADGRWRETEGTVEVRSVSMGGEHVTLVG